MSGARLMRGLSLPMCHSGCYAHVLPLPKQDELESPSYLTKGDVQRSMELLGEIIDKMKCQDMEFRQTLTWQSGARKCSCEWCK